MTTFNTVQLIELSSGVLLMQAFHRSFDENDTEEITNVFGYTYVALDVQRAARDASHLLGRDVLSANSADGEPRQVLLRPAKPRHRWPMGWAGPGRDSDYRVVAEWTEQGVTFNETHRFQLVIAGRRALEALMRIEEQR